MEIALVIIAFLFLLAGLVGSIVPAIPGPPLSWLGLLLIHFSGYGDFSIFFLCTWAVITLVVMIMDYFLPVIMTKKFGGSKAAMIGSVAGIFVGMFLFAPVGIIIGPFIGAFTGELINNYFKNKREKKISISNSETAVVVNSGETNFGEKKALKAALGAFLAFILGTGAKLIICSIMIFYAIKGVF